MQRLKAEFRGTSKNRIFAKSLSTQQRMVETISDRKCKPCSTSLRVKDEFCVRFKNHVFAKFPFVLVNRASTSSVLPGDSCSITELYGMRILRFTDVHKIVFLRNSLCSCESRHVYSQINSNIGMFCGETYGAWKRGQGFCVRSKNRVSTKSPSDAANNGVIMLKLYRYTLQYELNTQVSFERALNHCV